MLIGAANAKFIEILDRRVFIFTSKAYTIISLCEINRKKITINQTIKIADSWFRWILNVGEKKTAIDWNRSNEK